MTEEYRAKLIDFCVYAIAYLNDVPENVVERSDYSSMDDADLMNEADWLDGILGK